MALSIQTVLGYLAVCVVLLVRILPQGTAVSVKKSQEKTEVGPEGVLLRELLDASIDSKTESDLPDAEALFKKSENEEQERITDFSEWVQDIVRQPHPEIDFQDDLTESVIQAPAETEQDDVTPELTTDPDQLLSEADQDKVETNDQKEKGENAERPL
jgi:hypothetical protein